MAEKKQPATPATTAAPAAPAPTAPASTKGSADVFVFKSDTYGDKKPAPQARQIVEILKAKKTCTRDELVAAMTGVVQTRQPMGRILSYYQKKLVEGGFITVGAAA